MILSCPACQTRYLVPDSAIGPTGRQVRCAACRHSWFEEPPALLSLTRETELVSAGGASAPSAPPPVSHPEPPVRAPAPQPAPAAHPSDIVARYGEQNFGAGSADIDPFAHEPPFRPRRNPAKMWTIAAIVAAALMIAALAAIIAFGPSGFGSRLGLGPSEVPLTIQVTRKPERRPTVTGNELLVVTGRILNPTSSEQSVPDIHAELRDGQGRAVYSWTITRPIKTLAPGASADFDSAAVDVPRGSKALNLSFANAARE